MAVRSQTKPSGINLMSWVDCRLYVDISQMFDSMSKNCTTALNA